MKPDGLSSEMDEGEIVPSELYRALGLLVVESRIPHLSQKGHVDGPHCPSTAGDGAVKHDCCPGNFLCGRAEAIRHQIQVLWKNHVPMCIEVLLYPDCEHGSHKVAALDATLPGNRDSCILLEQWTIQVLPHRGGESVARARELFQAMKSYLHFSQLSAWLNLTQGKAPRNVSYRVSPPGEFCTSSFQEVPEWHTFPTCTLSKSSMIKVTVGAPPRHHNIIHVPCSEPHPMGHFVRTTTEATAATARTPWRQPQLPMPSQQQAGRAHKRAFQSLGQYRQHNQWQKGPGREGAAVKQPPWRSNHNHNNQIRTKKMPENFEVDLEKDTKHETKNSGPKTGLGSPQVPNHLDFTKLRSSPQLYTEATDQPTQLSNEGLHLVPPPSHLSQSQTGEQHPNPKHYHYQKRFSSPTVPSMEHMFSPSGQPYRRPHQYPQTPEDMPSYYQTAHLGAIPKRVPLLHKSPPNSLETKTLKSREIHDLHKVGLSPDLDQCNILMPGPSSKVKGQSPKVLFSKKSPGQTYFQRDDPRWVGGIGGRDSTDSDGSSPEIDKFLKNMTTIAQPLSTEEIQSYLVQLSHHQQSRNRKDISPLVRRSITDKDFAEAEAKESESCGGQLLYYQQGQHQQQQLPTKLQKALTEANQDLRIKPKQNFDQKLQTSQKWPHGATATVTEYKPRNKQTDVSKDVSFITSMQSSLASPTAGCGEQALLPKLETAKSETNNVSPRKLFHSKDEGTLSRTKDAHLSNVSDQLVSSLNDCEVFFNNTNSNNTLEEKNGTMIIPAESQKVASDITSSSQKLFERECSDPDGAKYKQSTEVCDVHKAKRSVSPLTQQLQKADSAHQVSQLVNGAEIMSIREPQEAVTVGDNVSKDSVTSQKTTRTKTDILDLKLNSDHNHVAVKFSIGEDFEVEEENEKNATSNGSVQNGLNHFDLPPGKTTSVKLSDATPSDSGQTCQQVPPPASKVTPPILKENNGQRTVPGDIVFEKAKPLLRSLIRKEMSQQIEAEKEGEDRSGRTIPTPQEKACFRRSLDSSTHMIFHATTGLPLQSSPAPVKKRTSGCFDYDGTLTNIRAIKNSLSCANLEDQTENNGEQEKGQDRFYSASAPASTNCLLGNFEESLLNGRIEPSGVVEGFSCAIGASGTFCPKHVTLPVTAFFFNLSDDNAPSPYLGHINLESLGRRGYHIPKKGTVQVTLFNPNKTVVKMFVVMYNLSDMPANCQTFLRQRTLYMPVRGSPSDLQGEPVFLRYLIHLRFSSSKSGKIYLHTDIRMIFARDKFEYDSSVAHYDLRSFTEGPVNPKFSPKR